MLTDPFGREITKLRIAVTDRCNLRCWYCMPESNIEYLPHEKILSFKEITDVVEIAANLGIKKIKITGGEPLLRNNISQLIKMLSAIKNIDDISMTTNGILLTEFAEQLAANGLNRVNISMDTLDSEQFCYLTSGGDINKVLAGIDAALKAGLMPIKINCVVEKSANESHAQTVKKYAADKNIKVQFIRLMNLQKGTFSVVEGGEGGRCEICNRIRLLCDGSIRPCLFSDISFNIREFGIEKALELAIKNKPKMGGSCLQNWMYQMGG